MMQWMVYNDDFNRKQIKKINILRNRDKDIKKLKKESKSYEEFCELLRREMMYQYWSRCEYEIILVLNNDGSVWLEPLFQSQRKDYYLDVTGDDFGWEEFADGIDKTGLRDGSKVVIKIDIYDQLKYKWGDFCRYCWDKSIGD